MSLERVQRISPEAPVPVVRVESESSAVGGSANVGANVVALGAACEMIGSVGRDAAGELLIEEIAALGAGVAGICMNGEAPPPPSRRAFLPGTSRSCASTTRTTTTSIRGRSRPYDGRSASFFPSCDVLVVEDYNKGILIEPLIETLIGCASERGDSHDRRSEEAALFQLCGVHCLQTKRPGSSPIVSEHAFGPTIPLGWRPRAAG